MDQDLPSLQPDQQAQTTRPITDILAGMRHPSEVVEAWNKLLGWKTPLSRTEAQTLIDHARANPEIMAAYTDRFQNHAPDEIETLKSLGEWLFLLSGSWPSDETGAPSPYAFGEDDRPIDARAWRDARAAQDTDAVADAMSGAPGTGLEPLVDAAPDVAQGRIEALRMEEPELWNAYMDKAHPDHDAAVRKISTLHQFAARIGAAR